MTNQIPKHLAVTEAAESYGFLRRWSSWRTGSYTIREIWYRVPRPDDDQQAPPPVVVVQKEQET